QVHRTFCSGFHSDLRVLILHSSVCPVLIRAIMDRWTNHVFETRSWPELQQRVFSCIQPRSFTAKVTHHDTSFTSIAAASLRRRSPREQSFQRAMTRRPNKTLQRTAASRSRCSRFVIWPPSLSFSH